MKRPTIEGLPSPATREERSGDAAASPGLKLDVVRNLRRRLRLAVGVGAGVFLLSLVFGLTRHRMYLAQSLTYIEPQASKVLSEGPSSGYDPSRYESYLQQQIQTALRPDILTSAIERLPPFTWQRPGESMPAAVFRMQNNLKVLRVGMSYQLAIQLMDTNPEKAAAVVNAVTNAYLEQGRKDEREITDQRLKLLGEERQRIEQVLSEDRVEQASLAKELGLASPTGPGVTQYDAQIAGAETQVAVARQARDVAAAQLASMQGGAGLDAAADEQLLTDSGLNSMKGTINTRKAVLSTQMAGLTPNNPIYQQDAAEMADLDRSLDRMTAEIRDKAARRLQDKMRADVQRTADIEGRLNAQLRQQTATASEIAPKLQRAAELAADLTRLNARYTVVDDTMRGLELEANGPGMAHLSVAATVPAAPEPSKRKLILLLALPFGVFAGLFAAVVAGLMDPRVYSGGDVERVLGFLPIAVMPAKSEVSARVLEEYTLRLAAGLQSAFRVSGAQSFVFAAASSTIETEEFVRSIERVLAGLGFKALVLDGSGLLRAERRAGSGQRAVASFQAGALVRTIDGNRQGHAMEELERLKQDFDLILIDAPPLLHSAETEYLARCADATILIAESGVTLKTELFHSATLLQQLNVAGVGAVLQEFHLKDADEGFRAAVEAVERMQRSLGEAVAAVVEREAAGERELPQEYVPRRTEVPTDTATMAEPLLERVAERHPEHRAEDEVRSERAEAAAEQNQVREPAVWADEPWHLHTTHAPVSGTMESERDERDPETDPRRVKIEDEKEPDNMGAWRDLWKRGAAGRTPESAVHQDFPAAEEVGAPDLRASEPVLFFEDRLRPRRSEEVKPSSPLPETPASPAVEELNTFESFVFASGEPEAIPEEHPLAEREPSFWDSEQAPFFAEVEPESFSAPPPTSEEHVPAYEEVALAHEEPSPAQAEAEEHVHPLPTVAHSDVSRPGPEMKEHQQTEEPADTDSAFMEAEVAAPAMASGTPAEPRVAREPAPPRMEWFTLKFRGTSERVLRIVPGEPEDDAALASLPSSRQPEEVAKDEPLAEELSAVSITSLEPVREATVTETDETSHVEQPVQLAALDSSLDADERFQKLELPTVHLAPDGALLEGSEEQGSPLPPTLTAIEAVPERETLEPFAGRDEPSVEPTSAGRHGRQFGGRTRRSLWPQRKILLWRLLRSKRRLLMKWSRSNRMRRSRLRLLRIS